MAHSWIEAAALLGFKLTLSCPEGYSPAEEVMSYARSKGAKVALVRDPRVAVEGVDVVTTDVWTSMGQEEEALDRLRAFNGYEVTAEMMSLAQGGAIFLHCLPAHRGEEVSAEVIEGPQSCVWEEAENRLHGQKALLAWLMAPGWSP